MDTEPEETNEETAIKETIENLETVLEEIEETKEHDEVIDAIEETATVAVLMATETNSEIYQLKQELTTWLSELQTTMNSILMELANLKQSPTPEPIAETIAETLQELNEPNLTNPEPEPEPKNEPENLEIVQEIPELQSPQKTRWIR